MCTEENEPAGINRHAGRNPHDTKCAATFRSLKLCHTSVQRHFSIWQPPYYHCSTTSQCLQHNQFAVMRLDHQTATWTMMFLSLVLDSVVFLACTACGNLA